MNRVVTSNIIVQQQRLLVQTPIAVPVGYPVAGYAEVGYRQSYAAPDPAYRQQQLPTPRTGGSWKWIPDNSNPVTNSVAAIGSKKNAQVFVNKCATCHKEGGKGSPQLLLITKEGNWAQDWKEYRPKMVDMILSGSMPPKEKLTETELNSILKFLYDDPKSGEQE